MGAERKAPMRHWDLFCGIGGFACALRDVCQTSLYCDINSMCRRVIAANVARGLLPDGEIVEDVRDMFKRDPQDAPPDIITAGFPCQDISVMGKRSGLDGARSGLVFVLMDVVERFGPKYVMLENLPAIRNMGLERVLTRMSELGYDCVWDTFSAFEAGGHHLRRRWFCLAVRRGCDPPQVPWAPHNFWSTVTPPNRLEPDSHANVTPHLEALGNAVVPQCARLALHCLSESFRKIDTRTPAPDLAITGAYVDGNPFSLAKHRPSTLPPPTPYGIVLRPRHLESNRPEVRPIVTDVGLRMWGTPTRMGWGKPKVLTYRTVRMFAVQVRMDVNSEWNDRDVPSPLFVEWIMGYPPGWTTYAPPTV